MAYYKIGKVSKMNNAKITILAKIIDSSSSQPCSIKEMRLDLMGVLCTNNHPLSGYYAEIVVFWCMSPLDDIFDTWMKIFEKGLYGDPSYYLDFPVDEWKKTDGYMWIQAHS